MQKDFDTWNKQKGLIHTQKSRKFYHEREIWWCSLGINIGYEHDGEGLEYQRPILILKALSKSTCLAIPLTSSPSKHIMRIPLGIIDSKEASAVISQIRTIDTKRLVDRICFLDKNIFEITRKAVKDIL